MVEGGARAVLLLGPTGAGKSDLAMQLARELPCEIVSVDSAQVYRGMDIGTAKPTAEERRQVPHHLLDLREPEERYSAGEFRGAALDAIADIHSRGRVPLLVGGTMLYFRALLHGIATLPPADVDVRRRIDARAALEGWPALHAELARLDPDSGQRVHPHDAQRIQRALEILELSGSARGQLWRSADDARRLTRAFAISVVPGDRHVLHDRLEIRFRQMLEAGLRAEVEALHSRPGLTADHPSMRAVGYRQLWEFCDRSVTFDDACTAAVAATRQLAKRQMTWLRGNLTQPAGETLTLDPQNGQCYELLRQAVNDWLQRVV